MDRRLSIGLASAALSLVVGLVLLLAGPNHDDSPDTRVSAAMVELDARIRETSAGVQARAVTLSQLPRLGWAVSTDPTTVRDLTQVELAFRPLPGESIEIAQIQIKGGQPLTLLRAPPGDPLKLPVAETGQRLLIHEGQLYVTAILAIQAHARADEIRGSVAVAQRLDLPAVVKQLESAGAHVKVETAEGAITLGTGAPPEPARTAPMTLGSPAAHDTKVTVLSPGSRGGGGRNAAGVVIILLGLAVAGVSWLRTRRAVDPAIEPELADPSPKPAPPVEARPTPPLPVTRAPAPLPSGPPPASAPPRPTLRGLPPPPSVAPARPASDRRPTPYVSVAGNEPDRRATPLVPLPTLEASGKHPPPDLESAGAAPNPASKKVLPEAETTASDGAAPVAVIVDEVSTTLTTLNADLARVTEYDRSSLGAKGANTPPEFRALFKEFVELRRTCGEPTEGLDADKFVVVLGQKRSELMARHAYKDVRFWVGFNDGKAVIRSRGIR